MGANTSNDDERLVATTRLALLVFRAIAMASFTIVQSANAEGDYGAVPRAVLVPLWFAYCVGVLVWLRRGKQSPRVLAILPHVLNFIDYGFQLLIVMPKDSAAYPAVPEIAATGIALILSFSVARKGTGQAVVSMVLACASYLIAVRWALHVSVLSTTFVLVSYIAFTTLAIRIVGRLRRRADEAMRLGQYTLDEKLGAGGMGVVYKAHHAMLRRPTAVKLLSPDNAKENSIARFEREVQLTAQLTHPNTIAIYDYGRTPEGIFYYAMEYLDGLNLEQLVAAHGALPSGRVVHILRQVCGSLAEAHAAGLIHRDIKPANVVVGERGGLGDVVKVLDFGLVKSVDEPSTGAVTRDDAVTGTPLYLSPESLVAPESVDARSDLYAVGCMGYFLLTGSPVFEGRSVVEICSHHLHTKPSRLSERTELTIPSDLEEIILACLAKEPDDRPRDARALTARLDGCDSADAWGDEDARAWWGKNRTSVKPRATKLVSHGNTIAVDFDARAGGPH